MKKALCLILFIFVLTGSSAWALPFEETGAPESLAEWEPWVLYGHEEQLLCPDAGGRNFKCLWPVSLNLDLQEEGGAFALAAELKKEGLVNLPGGPGAWPMEVKDSQGLAIPVLGLETPQIWLPTGRHNLSGIFKWKKMPETITVPAGFVLTLMVESQKLDFPAMEMDYNSQQARLWLKSKAQEPEDQEKDSGSDALSVSINRLVQDSQPMMIKSRFKLTVSGKAREILIPQALLPETRATFLTSPLPAQLTEAGLRVKVKPGIYEIFLDSRSLGRSEKLGPVSENSEEPEYWFFQAQQKIRLAEISGGAQIDPSQADVYQAWRSSDFPLYMLTPGESLNFATIRRGESEPKPDQLYLARECWLDYDGSGISCRDRVSGELSRQWHLNTSAPFKLAQASLDGEPQVITWQIDSKGEKAPGLQLRKGRLNLMADLRIDGFQGELPASGWDHKLESEPQLLNLPPGYKLLHVSGADAKLGRGYGAGTWTSSWSTLDFFLVLIITIVAWKLFGPKWGVLALVALIFCYHEFMAPRMVFLHLLATAAILRLLPEKGKAAALVRGWRFLAALILVGLTAMFLIYQARITMYPQLENHSWSGGFVLGGAMQTTRAEYAQEPLGAYYATDAREEVYYDAAPETLQNTMNAMTERSKTKMAKPAATPARPPSVSSTLGGGVSIQTKYTNRMVRLSQSPDAKVQNSAPRPAWSWRTVQLHYNSSVSADQEVRLYLVGPLGWRVLGLLRIALMSALTLAFLSRTFNWRPRIKGLASGARSTAAASLLLAFLALSLPGFALAAERQAFPDAQMLETLRQRLLAVKQIPGPSVPELRLALEAERLTMVFTVEAAQEGVFSLPTLDREIFRPSRISLDGQTDLPLVEENGRWLALVPQGRHRIVLEGRLKKATAAFQAFQINFPSNTRPKTTTVAPGDPWRVEGVETDGQLRGSALYVTAVAGDVPSSSEEEDAQGTSVTLSPFFLVQRTLSLGLEWQVHTTVRRITPAGAPVSLKLPLLPGENPVSDDLRPEQGLVTLNFGPQVEQLTWESRLKTGPELSLTAEDGPWTESWSLDVSPIWRVSYSGLTPIHNVSGDFWQPQWRPWPGESLALAVDRPEPVPGLYLVADRADLSVTVGENNRLSSLSFSLRASQGGPFSFNLPPGSEVREFKLDGRPVPLTPATVSAQGAAAQKESGPALTTALTPGEHNLEVSWVQEIPISAALSTPEFDLGLPVANVSLRLTMPEDRWILWVWGPLQGPAVLFWSLLAVTLLVSLALARFCSTPLKWTSWFLLGLGLIQLNLFGAMIVAGWFLALARRSGHPASGTGLFNLGQLVLAGWTIIALTLLYKGIEHGLLRNPDMLISGGGSYGQHLAWFIDRVSGAWPAGGALSVSIWVYKALMLAWSLWLAVSLVKWLRWAWHSFSEGGLWKKRPPRPRKQQASENGPDPETGRPDGGAEINKAKDIDDKE